MQYKTTQNNSLTRPTRRINKDLYLAPDFSQRKYHGRTKNN